MGEWHTNFWDKNLSQKLLPVSAAVQPPLSDTGPWWLSLPGDISFSSWVRWAREHRGKGTICCHLGWEFPTPAAEAAPALLELLLQSSQGAFRWLVRPLLPPPGVVEKKTQIKTTTAATKRQKYPRTRWSRKKNAKNTELGSHLASASYTILGGRSACSPPFPFSLISQDTISLILLQALFKSDGKWSWPKVMEMQINFLLLFSMAPLLPSLSHRHLAHLPTRSHILPIKPDHNHLLQTHLCCSLLSETQECFHACPSWLVLKGRKDFLCPETIARKITSTEMRTPSLCDQSHAGVCQGLDLLSRLQKSAPWHPGDFWDEMHHSSSVKKG